ncbi:MAG: hypothetical protein RLZZ08_179 [Pseudomonadota bacterium]|jgi:two-component system chemotaxis sensor kinase CheA
MTPEDIQNIFFAECEESLAAAEAGLSSCRAGAADGDTVNAIFRAVHSIKGGAGAFGHMPLQGFTHIFETLLSEVREGQVAMSPALVDLMLRALDVLSDHVSAARDDTPAPDDSALTAELIAAQQGGDAAAAAPAPVAPAAPAADRPSIDMQVAPDEGDFDLDALLNDISPAAAAEADGLRWKIYIRPHPGALNNGGEPVLLLRELTELGGECLACDISDVPTLDALDPLETYLGWTFSMPEAVSRDDVADIFDFIDEDCQVLFDEADFPQIAAITPLAADEVVASGADPASAGQVVSANAAPGAAGAANAAAAGGQSIRIDLAKLDRLIDGVGELVIAQAMLAQRVQGTEASHCEELGMLETLLREVQESAMSFRAQPIAAVFNRVPRLLRELAATTGKHVRLTIAGETTELDKTVVERLGEPLTHLIRNAVDHGIEQVVDRLEAGKPVEGTLSLSAEHRSGRIVIRIADDGRGIDRYRVLNKAIEKGLVSADAQLTDEEIDNLIFAPGFSTAEQVSNISGRGVGMDVVRQNVKELGGRITIESTPGVGTAFVMTLPLTLAISDGMIVQVGDQTLVIPLAHVVESLRPQPGEVQGLGAGCQMLNIRGRFIPILELHGAVGSAGAPPKAEGGVVIVVESEGSGRAALLVDSITDQRQFVIKSLDTHYRTVDGVAGATILGDGGVALILDVDGLVAAAIAKRPATAPVAMREAA